MLALLHCFNKYCNLHRRPYCILFNVSCKIHNQTGAILFKLLLQGASLSQSFGKYPKPKTYMSATTSIFTKPPSEMCAFALSSNFLVEQLVKYFHLETVFTTGFKDMFGSKKVEGQLKKTYHDKNLRKQSSGTFGFTQKRNGFVLLKVVHGFDPENGSDQNQNFGSVSSTRHVIKCTKQRL